MLSLELKLHMTEQVMWSAGKSTAEASHLTISDYKLFAFYLTFNG